MTFRICSPATVIILSIITAVELVDEWDCKECKRVMGDVAKALKPPLLDKADFVEDFKLLMVNETTCYYKKWSNWIPKCCEQGGSVHVPIDQRHDGRADCASAIWDFAISKNPNHVLDPIEACMEPSLVMAMPENAKCKWPREK
ncbi:hypothetical protein Ddc_14952 [Ditylenchus destructor]|nr:hypothetical protein Ddc_14952 [Ditylenchus destructor]